MDAQVIVAALKAAPYNLAYAHKIKEEVKKMNDDECDFVPFELQRAFEQQDNSDIRQPLRAILN